MASFSKAAPPLGFNSRPNNLAALSKASPVHINPLKGCPSQKSCPSQKRCLKRGKPTPDCIYWHVLVDTYSTDAIHHSFWSTDCCNCWGTANQSVWGDIRSQQTAQPSKAVSGLTSHKMRPWFDFPFNLLELLGRGSLDKWSHFLSCQIGTVFCKLRAFVVS